MSTPGTSAGDTEMLTPDDAYSLDNPAWLSLTGAHARLGVRAGSAARYAADVSPFAALAPDPDEDAWRDLGGIVGPGGAVAVAGPPTALPAGWEVLNAGGGVQMIDTDLEAAEYPEAVRLSPEDVPEMLDLAARTRPGPFLPRTIEMGTYLGVRHRGRLVAMAGQRFNPPGWAEISAVCTDEEYRGRGLGTRLVQAVAADIRERGDVPFLHALATNTGAIRLYQSIGFTLRRRTQFRLLRAPGASPQR